EQVIPGRDLVCALGATIGLTSPARRYELHEPVGRCAANRKRVEVTFRPDDCEDEARADLILLRELVDDSAILLCLLVLEVRDHGDLHILCCLLTLTCLDRARA